MHGVMLPDWRLLAFFLAAWALTTAARRLLERARRLARRQRR
jgi:hypothetical protein